GSVPDSILKAMDLPKESVIKVSGTVKRNAQSKKGYEVIPVSIENLNPLSANIPFETTGKVPADLDVRLNYRYIDLRRLEATSIFNIQSSIIRGFRDAAARHKFTEIRPPSIVEAATEGGTDLFQIQYFEMKAYLAQSPQLYKQLCVIGGIDRVSMIVPVFRAEKHNTSYHLNESTQMDIEIGFADHKDAVKMLKAFFLSMLNSVRKSNSGDLEELGVELKATKIKEITYKHALRKLSANGFNIEFGSDLGREHEEMLCKTVGEAVLVFGYPTSLRAFYSMPNEKDPEISNSYDLIYRGLEISSGAQRIHEPEMLVEALRKRGLNPENFSFYIDAFRRGAPPHAGWSIGLERLTMKISGKQNIRECALFPRDRDRLVP
ncbi:MAG: aspartate--tRNA(Asn) ligase, partial [Candidatus Micrarchaeaceae archaeon]